jgi:hypothetical protein
MDKVRACGILCFLAHLRGGEEPIQSRGVRRRHGPSSSISRVRFVTAGAVDPKLCTYVPLGKSNSQTKFQSSLIFGLATRGQNPKHKVL